MCSSPEMPLPIDQHGRARAHARAHLRAHHARERLDERCPPRSVIESGIAQDAAVGLQRGHAHVLGEAAGIEVGGVQRVAGGVVAGQAVAAGVARHVVRDARRGRPPRRSSRPRPPRRRRRRPRARARSAPWARGTTRARRSRRCRSRGCARASRRGRSPGPAAPRCGRRSCCSRPRAHGFGHRRAGLDLRRSSARRRRTGPVTPLAAFSSM